MSEVSPQRENEGSKSSLQLPDSFELHFGAVIPSQESCSTVGSNLTEQIERRFLVQQGIDQLLEEYDFEYLSDDDGDENHDNPGNDDATIDTARTGETGDESLALMFATLKDDMRRVSKPLCPRRVFLAKRKSYTKVLPNANEYPPVSQVASELDGLDLEGKHNNGATSANSFNRQDIERREGRRRASKAADLAILRSNMTQDVGPKRKIKRLSFSAVEIGRYLNTPVSKRPSLLEKEQLSNAGWDSNADVDDDEALALALSRPTIEKIDEDLCKEISDESETEEEK